MIYRRNMKRLKITLIALCTLTTIFAQNDTPSFTTEDFVAGKNLLTNQEIKGVRYVFPKRIINFDIDSISNMLFVHTYRYGDFQKVSAIDPTQKAVIWSLDYNGYSERIYLKEGLLIHNKERKAICHDIISGNENWNTQYQLYVCYPKNKIGIGYPNPGFFTLSNTYTNEAKGIDLLSGKVIWERTIPRNVFWDRWAKHTDSTITIVCKGLHFINIKTGKGWDNNDKTEIDAFNHNLTSDVYYDSLRLYWGSLSNLWCLDNNGKIIWRTPLDPTITGESVLLKSDSLICLLNYGSNHDEYNNDHSYGTPYIAQFSTIDGNQKHFQLLNYKNNYIRDYLLKKDTLTICYPNRLAIYNLNNLSVIKQKEYKLKTNDKFVNFTGSWRYVKDNDGRFKPINKIDSTQITCTLVTKDNSVIGFNKELDQIRIWKSNDIYTLSYKSTKYLILSKNDQTVIITPEGKAIAEFSSGKNVRIQNNRLYYSDKNELYCIDIAYLAGITESGK